MTAPLQISFEVACPVQSAFSMWTSRIGSWWPPDHTLSGDRNLQVVLEGRLGGRIYERTPAGVEYDWGKVTLWEPPTRLAYSWHLGRADTDATDVEIRFVAQDDASTRIDIEHRGWERLGDLADTWRNRNRAGWETLLPHFTNAIERGQR